MTSSAPTAATNLSASARWLDDVPPPRRLDSSSLDDLATRVKRLGFPVYWLVGWAGTRRISSVMGTEAVSLLHTLPEPSDVWIEVETRVISDDAPDPSVEADAALEEILWHELEEVGGGASRIADANAEIIRRVAEAPHRHVQVVVDRDGVDLLMVGDVETWAAAGHKGGVALRISSKGVEVSAIELERVRPDELET